jgi:hypothetical protein
MVVGTGAGVMVEVEVEVDVERVVSGWSEGRKGVLPSGQTMRGRSW